MMRLLVVEDDRRLAATLRRGLGREGFGVDLVGDGEEALSAVMTAPFDLILLDVMLPGATDGFGVCHDLRDRGVRTPVLMLTARDNVEDRVRGLNAGADDYLVKPFDFSELLARIRALTRRHSDRRAVVMRAGPLAFDTVARQVTVRGDTIGLTLKELAILEYFMRHPGALLSATQIQEHVWNYDFESESNLVEVYMARLRRRLGEAGLPDPWVTVRGAGGGYRFEPRRLAESSPAAPGRG
jgi:two-component system OmpR family response regulator